MNVPKLKKEHTKLAVVALLASVLTAAPIAVIANAQDTQEQNPVVEMINGGDEEQAAEEEETLPPAEEETPPATEETEEVPVEENEGPVEDPEETAVDILAAIAIAKTAHDEAAGKEAEVIKAQVKLKKLGEEKVYKVVFADGWRIYVRASDGEVVLMKDRDNRKHACGNRGRNAVASWRSSFKKKWGFGPTRNRYDSPAHQDRKSHNKHNWKKDQSNNEQQEPAETEEATEPEG